MLTDHARWKCELARLSAELRQACDGPRTADKDFEIEKSFLMSGFILRKLIEAGKISQEALNERLHVTVWPAKHDEIGYLQIGKIASGHDASMFATARFEEAKASESLSYKALADVIVHSSSLFLRSRTSDEVAEILVNSERTRDKIHCIDVSRYSEFLATVIAEELGSFAMVVDRLTGRSWLQSHRKNSQPL